MLTSHTLRNLEFPHALELVAGGGAFVDLRPTQDYLDAHIPGSLGLLYEWGPGMASRARDCIPLSVPLVFLESPGVDMLHAAASLRGKGFDVTGMVEDGLNAWVHAGNKLASTESIEAGGRSTLLHVGDPGATPPEGSVHIPIELLWERLDELKDIDPIAVVAGFGVRAALAIGMLERAGHARVARWRAPAR